MVSDSGDLRSGRDTAVYHRPTSGSSRVRDDYLSAPYTKQLTVGRQVGVPFVDASLEPVAALERIVLHVPPDQGAAFR